MRITNSMMVNNILKNLGNNLERMDRYQQQMATGKKVQRPSDDPIVAARALKLRTDVSEIKQYEKNTKDAASWMEITESALGQMGDILHRARELAVQASSSILTETDTQKIATEINQLKSQMVNLANSTYAGRYVFSGYSTDKALMDSEGNFNVDVKKDESILYEIGIGDRINVNIPGGMLFNREGDAVKGNQSALIKDIADFESYLNTGNFGNIQECIESMNDSLNLITKMRADIGARANRVEFTADRLGDNNVSFTQLMSENEDIDLAEVIMNLKNEENVYRSSLSGGARIIQPSLVDFLG